MADHKIEQHYFEFWRGSQPTRITEHAQRFERPGADGATFRTLGQRGDPFECELVSWFPNRNKALEAIKNYTALVGADPVEVRKDGENFLATRGVRFVVLSVLEISCQTCARLLGPGKNYPNGTEVVTRWTMAPVEAS